MKQRVKNVSYLCVVALNASDLSLEAKDIVALPKGAEVLSVDVQVLEKFSDTAKLDIGLNENANFFANDIALSLAGSSARCNPCASLKEQGTITALLNEKVATGKVIIRVHYFLPSEIMVEY